LADEERRYFNTFIMKSCRSAVKNTKKTLTFVNDAWVNRNCKSNKCSKGKTVIPKGSSAIFCPPCVHTVLFAVLSVVLWL